MPPKNESSEEMDKRYENLFKKLDKSSSGRINIVDLTTKLRELGLCPKSLNQHAEVIMRPRLETLNSSI